MGQFLYHNSSQINRWLILDFKLGGGGALKKLRRAEGRAKIVGVFPVKNHDFTPKNHIFSNLRGAPPSWIPPVFNLRDTEVVMYIILIM